MTPAKEINPLINCLRGYCNPCKFQSVSVDLITHLPLTRDGHTAIVVFVDRLSKMVNFAPAWTDTSAIDMA